MSRVSIMDDKAAQICYKYLHGEYDEKANISIYETVIKVVPYNQVIYFIFEIAYRIGYAKSALMDDMSEVTYKKRKKAIRDEMQKIEFEEVTK